MLTHILRVSVVALSVVAGFVVSACCRDEPPAPLPAGTYVSAEDDPPEWSGYEVAWARAEVDSDRVIVSYETGAGEFEVEFEVVEIGSIDS
jgi:hypothetical protein